MRESVEQCRSRLGISEQAAVIYCESELVDLHIDSFIWSRLTGYDIAVRHNAGPLSGRFFRQVDLPRLAQVGVAGATWVITTNPLRTASGRRRALCENVQRLEQLLNASGQARVVTTLSEYHRARSEGLHAAFLGVQGGNALGPSYELDSQVAARLLRVTLVHLTSSRIGKTSSPLGFGDALGSDGQHAIESLNANRVLVDLAHISRRAFYQALDVHCHSLPPIVTHTGVCGAHRHWRNLDDAQARAIADRGGLVGIMYHTPYLRTGIRRGSCADVARHIRHAINVCGTDGVALGSDWDGAIVTPADMPTCLEIPRLVQALLDMRLDAQTIRRILAGNFLRLLGEVRP